MRFEKVQSFSGFKAIRSQESFKDREAEDVAKAIYLKLKKQTTNIVGCSFSTPRDGGLNKGRGGTIFGEDTKGKKLAYAVSWERVVRGQYKITIIKQILREVA